jgi:hypothetical protein
MRATTSGKGSPQLKHFPFVTGTANPCHPIGKGSPTQNALRRCHPSSPPALIVFHRVCSGRTAVRPYYMADTVVCLLLFAIRHSLFAAVSPVANR